MSITIYFMVIALTIHRSEKYSTKEKALARLNAGENFCDVALEYAEHKREEGKSCIIVLIASEY